MNLDTYTPAQREAITSDAAEILTLAGPGSGKTATLVARIHRLAARTSPPDYSQICCLTFTNAAANELARRLKPKDAPEGTAAPELGFCGTLHSFALRMLKEYGAPFGYGDRISIISPESAADLLASKAKTLGCKTPMKDLLALKAKGRPARTARMDLAATAVASFLDDLREAGVVDYDVLIHEFIRCLAAEGPDGMAFTYAIESRFGALFVDEVQDSAPLDWAIYRSLPIGSKFYVGDPDQAIYSFRGGRVAEMLSLATLPGVHVVRLEENFRSHAEVCEAAQRLIERNARRMPKRTISTKGPGGLVQVAAMVADNAGEEIAIVARSIRDGRQGDQSIAVLARTNAIADGFRKSLAAAGVPVVEQTRTQLPPDWGMARAFVELCANPDNDALAFFYLIALFQKRGASPSDARKAAHAARNAAAIVGKTLNRANIGLGRITQPENALSALAGAGVSRESVAIAAEKFRELPPGAGVLDLALALADVREHVKEGESDGVHVLTVHGAKGREFDVVFIAGFEDEAFPGMDARTGGEEGVEEARRLAYVAITRARRAVYITHAASRVTSWGETVKRTPSRFIAELQGTGGVA